MDIDADDLRIDRSGRAGCPRPRHADERLHLRLGHVRAEPDERPSSAEGPFLLMNIDEPPGAEFFLDPFGRLSHRWRALQPWTVHVREPADMVERLRPVQPLIADLRQHPEIELAGVLRMDDGRSDRARGDYRNQRAIH